MTDCLRTSSAGAGGWLNALRSVAEVSSSAAAAAGVAAMGVAAIGVAAIGCCGCCGCGCASTAATEGGKPFHKLIPRRTRAIVHDVTRLKSITITLNTAYTALRHITILAIADVAPKARVVTTAED
eukprot:CAMPEP_0185427754 /NCGR_PEP_ID=MMETSP1365-20130426/15652_1 /TAXON_ID=38817 /ORGANISM="Gephyrocapsa oceanica, Strain RCC1303" /LENGTH=125 /DNA_ID=CAMNT_0028031905 /DNA_START=388 /DNA_END=765 /DNA_ORIENTATION=+